MAKLSLQQTLSGHKGRVWSVAWHPSGETLASCGEDKTIRVWSHNKLEWITKAILTEGHTRTIREVAWSACGNYLASASFDGTVAIWDQKMGQFECNTTLEGHENEVKSVSWSASGQLLATCSRDKSVWVWEIQEEEYECAAVINAHAQDVKKVRWHPNDDILASASYDDTVKIFKEDRSNSDWLCVSTLASHTSTVWSLSFDSTGQRLVTCSDDRTLKIWQQYLPGNPQNIPTEDGEPAWRCVCTLSGYHSRAIYDVDWCKRTGLIVTACGDDVIRVFEEERESNKHEPTFALVCSVKDGHAQDVNCSQWNPFVANVVATASDDGTVKVWTYSCD